MSNVMIKLTTKEDIALLVEEASEMFEETGCVPDVDGKKVRAEKIVPRAKQYILETIDNPKASECMGVGATFAVRNVPSRRQRRFYR